MENLYIVIPAYNEAENIEACVRDWYPIIEKHNGNGNSRLVIINDGSKDNTLDILLKMAETKPFLQPLDKINGGHGSAVLYGYRYAIDNNAAYVFQTDSDGQTDSKEFEQFWDLRHEYDAIIGKRVVRGDGKYRKFVEDVACLLLRIIFVVKV